MAFVANQPAGQPASRPASQPASRDVPLPAGAGELKMYSGAGAVPGQILPASQLASSDCDCEIGEICEMCDIREIM